MVKEGYGRRREEKKGGEGGVGESTFPLKGFWGRGKISRVGEVGVEVVVEPGGEGESWVAGGGSPVGGNSEEGEKGNSGRREGLLGGGRGARWGEE